MKKVTIPLSLLTLFLCSNITCTNPQKSAAQPTLVKLWETQPVFNVPESVCYDPASQLLFVANIGGKPTEKDSNGFISMCSLDGKVMKLDWASGLHAPKGMGISNGKLFVSDIDRIAEIDLSNGEVLQYFDVTGSSFLNDIAIGPAGEVYISDMGDRKIYRLKGGKLELFLDDEMVTGPNGLFVKGTDLMIGCKKIVKAPLSGEIPEEWLSGTGSIDGLEGTGDERFLFSDWQGNVFLVNEEKQIINLLDLTRENKNAADIEYIPSEQLLLIPTFRANTVVAYKLEN